MKSIPLKTRPLGVNETIPYDLLLLADETIEAINRYIFDSEIYVLELEERWIAVYVLQTIDSDVIEIKNIAVEQTFQGQGIGKFLLADAALKSREKGFKVLVIGTGDASFQQLQLYQKVGFKIFEIKKDFFLINYPAPIYENGILLKHMVMLRKIL